MGIYLGDKQGTLYRGSYKPVNLYSGDKKAAGWKLSEKTGTSLEWADTYNDKVVSAVVAGASTQVQTVQGKNLFDKANFSYVTGYRNDGGALVASEMTGHTTMKIPALASRQYTISGDEFIWLAGYHRFYRVYYYDSLKNWISRSDAFSGSHLTAFTFVTPSNTAFIDFQISLLAPPIVLANKQLELGSTATAYEPFTPNSPSPDYPSPIVSTGEVSGIDLTVTGNAGQSYSAHRDMVLRSLPDGTHDTWDVVTGVVTRARAVRVLDGVNTIVTKNGTTAGTYMYYIQFAEKSNVSPGLCTHFKHSRFDARASGVGTFICNSIYSATAIYINFYGIVSADNATLQNANEANAWLASEYAAGTPVTVLYQLAEPTIEQIDPMALPTYPHYTRVDQDGEVKAHLQLNAKVIDR